MKDTRNNLWVTACVAAGMLMLFVVLYKNPPTNKNTVINNNQPTVTAPIQDTHDSYLDLFQAGCMSEDDPDLTYQQEKQFCQCATDEISAEYPTSESLLQFTGRPEATLLADDNFQRIIVSCVQSVL